MKKSFIAVATAIALSGCGQATTVSEQQHSAPTVEITAEAIQSETARINEWFEKKYNISIMKTHKAPEEEDSESESDLSSSKDENKENTDKYELHSSKSGSFSIVEGEQLSSGKPVCKSEANYALENSSPIKNE